ncbi:MAG: hypothetical protein ACREDC_00615 [Bradyrhizobium sp.]
MSPATSPSRMFLVAGSLVLCLAGIGAAAADPAPSAENGRYALSPTADGVLRLDTRTGVVSACSNGGHGWACYAAPDERKAMDDEIGRLEAENEKLNAELAARGPAQPPKTGALPKSAPQGAPEAQAERRIEIPLPSAADVARVESLLQHAWRRLLDMAKGMQSDGSGKI